MLSELPKTLVFMQVGGEESVDGVISLFVRCEHEATPMEVQEDAFAGLAIVGLVDTDGDLTTSVARRNSAVESFWEIDGLG